MATSSSSLLAPLLGQGEETKPPPRMATSTTTTVMMTPSHVVKVARTADELITWFCDRDPEKIVRPLLESLLYPSREATLVPAGIFFDRLWPVCIIKGDVVQYIQARYESPFKRVVIDKFVTCDKVLTTPEQDAWLMNYWCTDNEGRSMKFVPNALAAIERVSQLLADNLDWAQIQCGLTKQGYVWLLRLIHHRQLQVAKALASTLDKEYKEYKSFRVPTIGSTIISSSPTILTCTSLTTGSNSDLGTSLGESISSSYASPLAPLTPLADIVSPAG